MEDGNEWTTIGEAAQMICQDLKARAAGESEMDEGARHHAALARARREYGPTPLRRRWGRSPSRANSRPKP